MTAAALEPAAPGGDAFVDALVRLHRLCGWLGPMLDPVSDAAAGELPGIAPVDGDDLLDAVLGAVSLRTTLALVLAALGSEPTEPAEEPAAGESSAPGASGWSRELLR